MLFLSTKPMKACCASFTAAISTIKLKSLKKKKKKGKKVLLVDARLSYQKIETVLLRLDA